MENKTTYKSDVQIMAEIRSPKHAFDALSCNRLNGNKVEGYTTEYCGVAEGIMEQVVDKVNGFQKDIAEKALGGYGMSDKQKWCVCYAYIKMELTADYLESYYKKLAGEDE